MNKKVAVVGGGTAGLLAALSIKQRYPGIDVAVIRSEDIGIIGVGEGTTPAFTDKLRALDIPYQKLIRHTKSAFKYGINFVNWTKDKDSYFHSFSVIDPRLCFSTSPDLLKNIIKQGRSPEEFELGYQAALHKKSPFIKNGSFSFLDEDYNDENTDDALNYAVHFDAADLAAFFENICKERDIEIVNDELVDVVKDNSNYISAINLKSSGAVDVDFVVDCTGLHRKIIGEQYNVKWSSYKEHLPCNKAQPFWLPVDDKMYPWTDAIAQDAGWIWRIPLQHRYGCGYVYDSSYISNDEVRAEILRQYPNANIIDRIVDFEAGHYDKCLVKNCLAVGLSAGFIEPLEATSLHVTITQIDQFLDLDLLRYIVERDDTETNDKFIKHGVTKYNEVWNRINEDVSSFVQLHYISDRDDTAFWREYRHKNKLFDYLNVHLDVVRRIDNHPAALRETWIFCPPSWLLVGHGLKLSDKSYAEVEDDYDLDHIKKCIDKYCTELIDIDDIVDSNTR